jgi:DNA-binding FrmR family transcriptional regulator
MQTSETHATQHTDPATRADLTRRLNRAAGQIQAISRMVEHPTEYSCREVVSQIKAARSALRKVSELYISAQVTQCITLPEPQRTANIKEALKALAVE